MRTIASIITAIVSCLQVTEARSQEPGKPDLTGEQAAFYDPDVVQTIELWVAGPDLERMHEALPERIYVPGRFRWNGVELERAGVRYRGDSSSSPRQRHKRSFLIKFSEFTPGGRFLGLRRVALDNGVQFGGLFSERLITDTLRAEGLPAPRTNYARVFLNGEYRGLYVNVERIDRAYLAHRFGDAEGDLYKVQRGGPGADLGFVGEDPLLYSKAFEPKGENDSLDPVVSLIREINEIPPERFAPRIREILDVDALISGIAVLLLSGAFDQYTGWGPHNYYLYRSSSSGRWTYLPWDLDVGFVESAFGRVAVIDGWNAAWPVPASPRPLLERIVADEELLALYRRRADELLERHFRPEVLGKRLDALYTLIEKDLEKEPFKDARVTVPGAESHADVVRSMKEFMRRRYRTARAQLDSPGPRPAVARGPDGNGAPGGGDDGPRPGSPSADAPSDLRIAERRAGAIRLAWKDNATGEAAFIVQRCEGEDCDDFVNAVGRPGEDITEATDTNVEEGRVYRYRVYALRPAPDGPRGTGVSNVVTATSLFIDARDQDAEERPIVLVVYHSKTGNTKLMAEAVAAGARASGKVRVHLKTVGEATNEDVTAADAVIIGSPVYNANVAPEVMAFINEWPFRGGALRDKIGAAFVTAGGMSAGEEAAQMSLLRAMLTFGMIAVGGPGWRQAFGASAIVAEDPSFDPAKPPPENRPPVAAYYLKKGEALGGRVADVVVAWTAGRRAMAAPGAQR